MKIFQIYWSTFYTLKIPIFVYESKFASIRMWYHLRIKIICRRSDTNSVQMNNNSALNQPERSHDLKIGLRSIKNYSRNRKYPPRRP
jgi:hypothetical protein